MHVPALSDVIGSLGCRRNSNVLILTTRVGKWTFFGIKSCDLVSCLINMEPLEVLSLQPKEPIASESAAVRAQTNRQTDGRYQIYYLPPPLKLHENFARVVLGLSKNSLSIPSPYPHQTISLHYLRPLPTIPPCFTPVWG